jgi:catechol 2,3-dioxygenase-like lactoylglutathione lyase family enzyme
MASRPPPPAGTLESALYVDDLAAAEAFYGALLGLPSAGRVEGRHVFFRVGPSILLIFNPEATSRPPAPTARLPVPPHGAKGPGHYCFSVMREELDPWRDYLRGRGVAIEAELTWPNGARSFYIRDPGGNSVEFAEPGLWE